MAFRIHDVTIQLMPTQSDDPPCTKLTGDPGHGPCKGKTEPPCQGRTQKPKPSPGGDNPPGGGRGRSLAFLQARLREALAPPPL